MEDAVRQKILGALLATLRPLARILLRSGIGYREFNEVAKSAFVDVATKNYGLRGRPTNISRVAVMTGLTRKEVRRLRDKIESGDEIIVPKSTPLAEVLHRWYSDPEFLDSSGRPKKLKFDGKYPSFSELVKRAGGDIPPGAMRTELKRIRAITIDDDEYLAPTKRSVTSAELHEKVVTGLQNAIYPLAATVAHNTNPANEGDTWTQRTVYSRMIRKEDMARIKRISRDRLQEFAMSMDDFFMAYETLNAPEKEKSEDVVSVGVGVFYFQA